MVATNRIELALDVNGVAVTAREGDRYVRATELCSAAGKKWSHYWENDKTKSFIQTLAESTGIPAASLVQMKSGRAGGTWIHPQVVIHFAMWVDDLFAARVTLWAARLLAGETVKLTPEEVRGVEYDSPGLIRLVHDIHSLLNESRAVNERQVAISERQVAVITEQGARIAALEERLASLPTGLSRSVNAGPLWTVQDVLHESGWFTTSARQRANIRDRANRAIRLHTGQEVELHNGYSVYTRSQVKFVDSSIRIERMKAELDEAERGLGLFESAEAA